MKYNSEILYSNISRLKNTYSFLEIFSIGKSVLEKDIHCIKVGNGSKEVFYSGSIHANEWIVTPVLMKFTEDFCRAYVGGSNIFGYSAKEIFNTCTIYIVPMCNPDGVDLVTGLIEPNSYIYEGAKQIAEKYPNVPFPLGWKANIERSGS